MIKFMTFTLDILISFLNNLFNYLTNNYFPVVNQNLLLNKNKNSKNKNNGKRWDRIYSFPHY